MRAVVMASVMSLVGCGARVDDGRSALAQIGGDAGAETAPPPSGSSKTPPGEDDPPPAIDGGVGSASIGAACGGDASASKPDSLRSWVFVHEHEGCGGVGTCSVALELDSSCSLVTHDGGSSVTKTMAGGDCASLRSWLASDTLQSALKDPALCSSIVESGNPDSNEFDFGDGVSGRKTPRSCTETPLDHHRACIQAVLDVYRPGAYL